MIVKQTPDRTVVQFSASELAALGLPAKPAQVEYDALLRLDTYSCWLTKQTRFDPGIDRLVALADTVVYH